MLAAVFEPEAFAVHLQDVDMMGEPVEERAGEAFGTEDTGPFIVLKARLRHDERQVRCHDGRAALIALGEDLKEKFGPGWR